MRCDARQTVHSMTFQGSSAGKPIAIIAYILKAILNVECTDADRAATAWHVDYLSSRVQNDPTRLSRLLFMKPPDRWLNTKAPNCTISTIIPPNVSGSMRWRTPGFAPRVEDRPNRIELKPS